MNKAKSPYQRYAKTPHRYSEVYYRWRTAIREGKHAEARRAPEEHAAKFSPRAGAAQAAAA
jgi:hypothetical protein